MYPCFDVDGISVEKLLANWKWLVVEDFSLLAINAFGDLFLKNAQGTVHRLDITAGKIAKIADSETGFRKAAEETAKQKEWLLADDEKKAALKGYAPRKGQCVGSKIPWVFKESATVPDNLCVIELYQYVSFMADMHYQMRNVPEGGQVRIKIVP